MKRLYIFGFIAFPLSLLTGCNGQTKNTTIKKNSGNTKKIVGGGCDGCEVMYVGMPARIISVDTSVSWREEGKKLLVTGTVYKPGGKIPAPGVVVYYYHTDNTGHYTKRNDKPENKTVHGHIRGWVKTDARGHYEIYTIRPAPYPDNKTPAHIHLVIKEPAINEYYIDELVFNDDPLLTGKKRSQLEQRGGSGILKVENVNNAEIAKHNIILGLNIPDYPLH